MPPGSPSLDDFILMKARCAAASAALRALRLGRQVIGKGSYGKVGAVAHHTWCILPISALSSGDAGAAQSRRRGPCLCNEDAQKGTASLLD